LFAQQKTTTTKAVTNDITAILNKGSLIKFMHMSASVRDPCHVQITPQHNSL